jgi:hypothetical protein
MSTTTEFWDVNGTSLNTLAWNIETLNGRQRVPQLRGDDTHVPFRPGAIWRPKQPDSRTLTLAMWVLGCNIDGSAPVGGSARAKFNDNRESLIKLFYSPDTQLSLTKRWQTMTGLKQATGLAELMSDMDASMLGIDGAQFAVDLRLADPYFYGPTITPTALAVGVGAAVTNPGVWLVQKMTIVFNGGLTNPRLTNSTTGVWVQYTGVIAGGASVTLNTDLFTAITNTSVNVIGAVTHQGARNWLPLRPGSNMLTLTASAGTGTATVSFQPPYI